MSNLVLLDRTEKKLLMKSLQCCKYYISVFFCYGGYFEPYCNFSRLMRIDRCELVLVDVTPVGSISAVTQQRQKMQVIRTSVSHYTVIRISFDVLYLVKITFNCSVLYCPP